MISVQKLKEELENFDDECMVYAYEGESIGLVIQDNNGRQGFIHCGEQDDSNEETEVIPRKGLYGNEIC